jgi:Ion channel
LHLLAFIAGTICCLGVALDAFQTIVLPRRPAGRFRITRFFFVATWGPWKSIANHTGNRRVREQVYSVYGPLSLLLLLLLWGGLLIFGFSFFFYALGSPFTDVLGVQTVSNLSRYRTDLYVSGTTLFTLGLGDVVPHSLAARTLIIFESGVGLGFVALVIGYLPVLYQAFSRREVSIALLDARAGSPPAAVELLRRHGFEGGEEALTTLLAEWERWSAEILESHISYPILCFYRSQHDNQSWLSALVAILDTCALLISVIEGTPARQAQLTFVMARHALVDLGHVFNLEDEVARLRNNDENRLPPAAFGQLCDKLGEVHLRLCGDPASANRLHTIRALYEPEAIALSNYLKMTLPVWNPELREKDQWRLLTKLRNETEHIAGNTGDRARSAYLHHDEHGH